MKRLSTQQKLILLTLLAIAIRVVWGVLRFNADVLNVNFGDYDLYEAGAEHLLTEGDFTNSLFLVRPPLFSLMIAALGTSRMAVLVTNAILGGLITPIVYGIGRRLNLDENLALRAALLYALDFVAIVYGAALLDSVALGNIFAALMIWLLLGIPNTKNQTTAIYHGISAGLALVLSAYARAEIYLIWTGLSVWMLVIVRRHWRAIAAYALVSVIGIGAWTWHNERIFDNPSFSTVSGFTMAFYRAASVERIGSGDDIETVYMTITQRVEEAAGNDPDLATLDTRWGYHAAPTHIQNALYQVSFEIFREYPLVYLGTIPVGFIRMYALDPPFLRSTDEPLWMYIAVAWNWLFFLSATIGFVLAATQKRWLLFWCVFLNAGYYTAGTLMVKNAGMVGRERAVLTPFMAMVAVLTIQWAYSKFLKPTINHQKLKETYEQ